MRLTRSTTWLAICSLLLLLMGTACASSQGKLRAEMEEMPVQKQATKKLDKNHFQTDKTGNLDEEDLREILDAPVYLEKQARVGVVPVATAYSVDQEVPLDTVPRSIGDALEDTGFFEVTTEISTGWQRDRGIAGLRELAARYRVPYLLLYRHRFVERKRTNAWGVTYPTVIGALATPHKTVEVAGVMEATLFDVRTGTIMFTVFERVHDETKMNVWHQDHKKRELKTGLLQEATDKLSDKVTSKVRYLIAAAPNEEDGDTETADTAPATSDGPSGSVSTFR